MQARAACVHSQFYKSYHCREVSLIPGQSMQDMLWTQWHLTGFSQQLGFAQSVSFH